MKLKMLNWAKPEVKHLAQLILEGGRRGRLSPSQILESLCEKALERTSGRIPNNPAPLSERDYIDEVFFAYFKCVLAEERFMDVMGQVYMEVASHGHKKYLGQYFTAGPIARMMSAMTLGDDLSKRKDGRLRTTIDPAAGSGVMMLSSARHIFDTAGAEALKNFSFTCVDLDKVCALMSAAQFTTNLAAYDLQCGELVIVHGNSLWPDECWNLILHATCPGVRSSPIYHQGYKDAIQRLANESSVSLFDEEQFANAG